jgi:PTH1 family peptidyl-tRNA hydrolase
MWLIAGLGNPGADYALTRHNIGFMAVDRLADGAHFSDKFHGAFCAIERAGEKILLLKPQTFMNHSGRSVKAAMAFYKLPPAQLIVLHDELDLPLGKIRIKKGGGANGHNGLRDIDACVGQDYWRIRLGIGHPGTKEQVHGHVLSRFSADERAEVDKVNETLSVHFALFWQHSPEALATKVAQVLNPPRITKSKEKDDGD